MLMKGDLVRIPQHCRIFSSSEETFKVKVLQEPKIAIVLKVGDRSATVLVDDTEWAVKTKDLQLYGVSNVC